MKQLSILLSRKNRDYYRSVRKLFAVTSYVPLSDGGVRIDFDSCSVREHVTGGHCYFDKMVLSNEEYSLIALLIDYGHPLTPIYLTFNVSGDIWIFRREDGEDWSLRGLPVFA